MSATKRPLAWQHRYAFKPLTARTVPCHTILCCPPRHQDVVGSAHHPPFCRSHYDLPLLPFLLEQHCRTSTPVVYLKCHCRAPSPSWLLHSIAELEPRHHRLPAISSAGVDHLALTCPLPSRARALSARHPPHPSLHQCPHCVPPELITSG
jgi:hypothetical protein